MWLNIVIFDKYSCNVQNYLAHLLSFFAWYNLSIITRIVVFHNRNFMSEAEKQESQKTVVAFITGLLIGGLLVWVFSSTPTENNLPEEVKTDTVQVTTSDDVASSDDVIVTADDKASAITGKGLLTVADQKAGSVVALGKIEFPSKSGWVVVRDYMDGTPGNVLGAARYNSDEGLVPTTIELMRVTTAGSSYQVVFYSNSGEATFSLAEDTAIDGATATFKAN